MRKGYSPPNKIPFTSSMKLFVRKNYMKMTNQELADHFGVKITWMRTRIYEMGLKRQEFEYYNDEQIDFLKVNFVFYGNTELAEIFNINFPRKKPWTIHSFEKKLGYLKLKRTDAQLEAIQNRNVKTGRFSECARKRWETTGQMPVGSIRVWKQESYQFAVIKTETGFEYLSRYLWKKHKGAIPKGMCVSLKKGAPVVCSIGDLELISRAENAMRNATVDSSIIKRCFGEKDVVKISEMIENIPQIIALKRNAILLNHQINKNYAK